MTDSLDGLPDYVVGFEPAEVKDVVDNYVCPICHGVLTAFNVPMDRIYIIVCPEHGNVEQIGRVRRESVDSDMRRAKEQFDIVINNLPEFWGELKQTRRSVGQNLKELGF